MPSGGFARPSFKLSKKRNNRNKNQSWKASSPEAGRHPSNPVVERSWDAFFYCHEKKVGRFFEFFRKCVYIMHITFKIQAYDNNN